MRDTTAATARRLLEQVACVLQEREANYGPAAEHFARTAAMVSALLAPKLREPLTATDWALVMVLDKAARHVGPSKSADTAIDLVGYSSLLAVLEAANP